MYTLLAARHLYEFYRYRSIVKEYLILWYLPAHTHVHINIWYNNSIKHRYTRVIEIYYWELVVLIIKKKIIIYNVKVSIIY